MKHYLLAFFTLCSTTLVAQTTTYFEQHFNGSSTLTDYTGGGANKFSDIVGNSPSTAAISGGALQLNKTSGGQIRFSKSDNLFSETPTILYVQFTISANITEPSVAANAYNYLYVGSFNDSGTLPTNASVFARLGIYFPAVGNAFHLRIQDGGSSNKGPYTGTKTITWVMNVSGSATTYTDNTGHAGNLAANKMDVWVDGSLEFDDASELTTSVIPTDFKFLWNHSNGTALFDDLKIQGSIGPMPVELVYFKAQNLGTKVRMNWATASEKDARLFIVERSKDLDRYETVREYTAAGNSSVRNEYEVLDETPYAGKSYYRLRQIDTDGSEHVYRAVSVQVGGGVDAVRVQVLGNPVRVEEGIRIRSSEKMNYRLFTLQGTPVSSTILRTDASNATILPESSLKSGVYLLVAENGYEKVTQRIVVP